MGVHHGEKGSGFGPVSLRQVPDRPLLTTGPQMGVSLLSNPGNTAFLLGLLLGDRKAQWGCQGHAQLLPAVTRDPATQAESGGFSEPTSGPPFRSSIAL